MWQDVSIPQVRQFKQNIWSFVTSSTFDSALFFSSDQVLGSLFDCGPLFWPTSLLLLHAQVHHDDSWCSDDERWHQDVRQSVVVVVVVVVVVAVVVVVVETEVLCISPRF